MRILRCTGWGVRLFRSREGSSLVIAFVLLLGLNGVVLARTTSDKTAGPAEKDKAAETTSGRKGEEASSEKPATALSTDQQVQVLNDKVQKLEGIIEQQQKALDALQNQLKGGMVPAASSVSAAGGSGAPSSSGDSTAAVSSPAASPADSVGAVSAAPQNPEAQKKPAAIELAGGKIQLGATFYGDYGFYYQTGFGPQFLTQINQPGPRNDTYSAFDINRTYLNFLFSPNDAITVRITPNIYRQLGNVAGVKEGKDGGIGSSVNENLTFRLKYAYVDFNKLFSGVDALKEDKLTVGQQQNPLIDWEETLYGFRYVNLVPWNYLSLSSTFTGVRLHGPIKMNGKAYVDYEVGVFNDANFHQLEKSEKKTVMARMSVYPMGAKKRFDGIGFTGFIDYGFTNATPDANTNLPIYRVAALAHYTSLSGDYGIAGEFDYGRNAFGSGNLFSGSGPADDFGIATTQYAPFDGLVKALLTSDHTKQRGFDFFGHARIPDSPVTVFGMYQYFQPNINISNNPIDFQRLVAGLSVAVGGHTRLAFDSQNLFYTHKQFTFPASQLATFAPSLASSNPSGIPNAVPKGIKALFVNLEFNF